MPTAPTPISSPVEGAATPKAWCKTPSTVTVSRPSRQMSASMTASMNGVARADGPPMRASSSTVAARSGAGPPGPSSPTALSPATQSASTSIPATTWPMSSYTIHCHLSCSIQPPVRTISRAHRSPAFSGSMAAGSGRSPRARATISASPWSCMTSSPTSGASTSSSLVTTASGCSSTDNSWLTSGACRKR